MRAERLVVNVPQDMLSALDERRGLVTRSTYVKALLARDLGQPMAAPEAAHASDQVRPRRPRLRSGGGARV